MHADSILQCETFVEAQNSYQSRLSQDIQQIECIGVVKSPLKQTHRQTPSISHIQEINQVQFPVTEYQGTQDRSRSSATFDIVESRSPAQESIEETKETRYQQNKSKDNSQAVNNAQFTHDQLDCHNLIHNPLHLNHQHLKIEKLQKIELKREGESSTDFNISRTSQDETPQQLSSHQAQGESITPRSTSQFRKQLTERLRSHVEGNSSEGFKQIINSHNALLSPQSMSARTSLVSNPAKAITQRKLNFMRQERSPSNIQNGSQLAEPVEFGQVSTTPRYVISKPDSSTSSNRNEIATPISDLREKQPKHRKYNHKKFLSAIANACQKYAVEVLTKENKDREVKEKQKGNYNAEMLRESILSDLRERRQRVLQRSRQSQLIRSSKEIKPPSYPKGLLEYSLTSIQKSSRQNTPKKPKRHYSALALSQSNSQHLSLSQCSSRKSIPSIEIDLREQTENIKTEGWQEPEQKLRQAEELARKILGISQKRKFNSSQREIRQKQRVGYKNLRVHSQTMANLRTEEPSVESISNYSSITTPKQGSNSMESSYFFRQMKAKYLAQKKKIQKNANVNYIKRNIQSLKKMKAEQGKKKILKCNH